MKRRGSLLLWVVWLLMAGTGMAVGIVTLNVYRAGHDMSVREGLDYSTFLRALDDLIEGAGDSALVRFDDVDTVLPSGRRVRFDTIAIVADLDRFPSFRKAAFLHDQVLAYNRHQRERLAVARLDQEWFDRLEAFNPSVFRGIVRGDGRTGLTGLLPLGASLSRRPSRESGTASSTPWMCTGAKGSSGLEPQYRSRGRFGSFGAWAEGDRCASFFLHSRPTFKRSASPRSACPRLRSGSPLRGTSKVTPLPDGRTSGWTALGSGPATPPEWVKVRYSASTRWNPSC